MVPAGVMVAANAVNMLAGFNGMEVGMGFIVMGTLAVIAASIHTTTALIILHKKTKRPENEGGLGWESKSVIKDD